MSSAKANRDSKLEELRKIKAKNYGNDTQVNNTKSAPLVVPSNPYAAKAETWPEDLQPVNSVSEDLNKKPETQIPPIASEKKPKVFIPKNPFSVEKNFPVPVHVPEPVENDSQIDDLTIKYLKQQLEILEIAENSLKSSNDVLQNENEQLKKQKEKFDSDMENLMKSSETLLKNLESESEKVVKKMKKFENFKGSAGAVNVYKEIEELNNELDFFNLQSEEKEEEIERLKKEIQRANEESRNLQSLFNDGTYLSQPEPPPPGYNSVMDSHSQNPKRLLSDMGSTGAWNNKKKKT